MVSDSFFPTMGIEKPANAYRVSYCISCLSCLLLYLLQYGAAWVSGSCISHSKCSMCEKQLMHYGSVEVISRTLGAVWIHRRFISDRSKALFYLWCDILTVQHQKFVSLTLSAAGSQYISGIGCTSDNRCSNVAGCTCHNSTPSHLDQSPWDTQTWCMCCW